MINKCRRCFAQQVSLFEDLITVVSIEKVLDDDSHYGDHSKTSVVDLLVLVVNPALIAIINPVRGSEDVSWDVSRALLDILCDPLNSPASKDELKPSDQRKLIGGLKRVTGKARVESGVHTRSGDVPSKAGGHSNTSVLELGLAVESHDIFRFTLGETQGIKESHRGGDTNNGLILPGVEGTGRGLNLCRSKSSPVKTNNSNEYISYLYMHI